MNEKVSPTGRILSLTDPLQVLPLASAQVQKIRRALLDNAPKIPEVYASLEMRVLSHAIG